ncbi:MAG: TraM recognition domain-containing protein, partial [bacterium]
MIQENFLNPSISLPESKFSSPQEELEFLRRQIVEKEKALSEKGRHEDREKIIHEGIKNYSQQPVESLHENLQVSQQQAEAIVLNLAPEKHDGKMSEMIHLLREKGILNTLKIVEKTNDAHLVDDFHRFLVQYVKAGFAVTDLKEKDPLAKSLKMTLFEVSLPSVTTEDEKGKKMNELISGMEQFYSGMLSVSNDSENSNDYFVVELANPTDTEELLFYMAVPTNKALLFERQIVAIFPDIRITEQSNDYNVFNDNGQSLACYAKLKKNPIFPLRTYDSFDHDPLSVLLNVFSKVKKEKEGAAIQIVFRPCGDIYNKRYALSLERLAKGKELKEAIDHDYSISHMFGKAIFGLAKEVVTSKNDEKKDKNKPVDEADLKGIRAKANIRIVETNLRLVASCSTKAETEEVMRDMQSAFHQFDSPLGGNDLEFETPKGEAQKALLEDFSFRRFMPEQMMPLNLKEITTLVHLPSASEANSPFLRKNEAVTAPAPIELGKDGVLLGINKYRGMEKEIHFTPEDRMRHFYVIGQTGTGKTTILLNMIIQDIINGEGVCFIDPHGSDIQTILANIPKERYEDVIYFDPGYTDRPMGLNMLEYDLRFPDQKTFVVNEMMSIFNKLFDMKTTGGPMFEQYFRNAAMLVIDDPESGNTLLDISRVLADAKFRELKLSKCKSPLVVQFWREIAGKAGGEASLANIVPYIVSKFDVFLSNDIMRPIVSQEKSSFNFREIMDGKKILLVNLAKGRLGDINSSLLGLIIVGKILMAALSRVDSFDKKMNPFYLYVDEFQNVTTNSISQILSEARKYKLSLNIAHQFIAQLQDDIKNAVFGNVGSMAVYRVGTEDAEFLQKQFAPVFSAKDIMNIDNYNA